MISRRKVLAGSAAVVASAALPALPAPAPAAHGAGCGCRLCWIDKAEQDAWEQAWKRQSLSEHAKDPNLSGGWWCQVERDALREVFPEVCEEEERP